ncbi:MAG: thrombospondin, partial [Acidobacteria bacterium]|nr:thrombospondin [Acidobacteriota bacterium]
MKSWPFRTPEERRRPSDMSQVQKGATINFRRAGLAFFTTIATLIAFGVLLGPQAMSLPGGTFTVTNVADNTSGSVTAGSLRDGIAAANGGGCAAPCTIVFGVTGNINLFSPLPTITAAAAGLTIDGFSATGAVKNTAAFGSAINATLPVAVTSSSGAATAFDVSGSSVTIQGLVISGFNTRAVRLASVSGTVKGCFIGTNSSGTAAQSPPGATGIEVSGGTGNIIGGTLPADRNLISGNTTYGIWLSGSSATILGNYIGTNAAGTGAIASQPIGIRDDSGASDIGNATMGNVISGHGTNGILLATGTGTVIRNNRIGTNAAGTGSLGNSVGIFLGGAGFPSGVSIGGTAPEGNLIGGNATAGIEISSAGTANTISENNIGVNLAGTLAISNNIGIKIAGVSTSLTINNNRICGSAAPGVFIAAGTNTTITANDIGVYGSTAIGNGGRGVYVTGGTGTSITNNKVVNNVGNGVDIDGPTGVKITGNSIGSNTSIGIDLHASALNSGATPNDGGDLDIGGGNNYQNFPNITSAVLNGSTGTATLTAKFLIDSVNVVASQSFKVELFEADTSTTPQGLRLLGSQCYAGNSGATLSMSVPTAGLSVGSKIVGTATSYTDAACTTVGDGTSEFSTGAITTLQPGLVVNTNDSGVGTLRQAILDANTGTCASPCTITFNIPTTDANYSVATGTFAIKPLSALSVLAASNAFMDGKTQTTFTGNTNASGPEIVIDGALAGVATDGLHIGYSVGGSGSSISIRSVVVNNFQGYGIVVAGNGVNNVTNATVVDCYVGTDRSGTIAQANGLGGIDIQEATNTQIGLGTNLGGGQPNVVSGNNGNGITILNATTSSTKVSGNNIGLDASGTSALANNGAGVYIGAGAINSLIGGGSAAFGNNIAFNSGAGVAVVGTSGQNGIRRNSIYSNGGLGIDLNNDGITGNDTGDGDTGPNNLQNAPVLTSATYSCGSNTTVITGTLNSSPGTSFEIDWFSSPTVDPSGHGEGKTYQNTSNFTTDALGDAAISIALTGDFRTANITATATKQASTETSEFSARPTAVDSAPVATTDAIVTSEDTAGSTNVLTNDSDNECDTLSIAGFTQGATGSVNCFSTTCTYTPNLNTNGSDTFTYTVSDGTQTTTGTVNVTVNSVNDPPVATNDTVAGFEDTPATFNVLINDNDVDGPSPLTVSGTTAPSSGSVVCSPSGGCTYTPATNANGSATFNYTATDGSASTTGTVTINLTAVNDPPSFNSGGNVTVSEDSAPYSAAWATAISAGPADESGQVLSFNVTNTNGALFTVQPSIASNGVLSFTPAANANGTASVNVTLLDNGGVLNGGNDTSASQTFTIAINAVNDPPSAVNDSLTTSEDTPSTVNVLTNDTDPENDTLTILSNTNGTLGNAVCSPTGACTYTPNLNANGVDSFTYTITDGALTSTATVNVTINAVNDAPVANGDSYSVAGNSTLTVAAPGVLGNDTDVDGVPPLTAMQVSGPAHGSATLNADGSLSYTPALNYTGPDSIIYNAKDAGGAVSNNATININVVTPINAADLALAITDSPDPVAAGSAVTYIATVSNSGPNTNSAYSVNFTVTGGTITGTSGAATCSGGTTNVACTGTAIGAGNSANISLVVNAGAGASVQLSGAISYAVDPNTSNNSASQTTTITPSADLTIAKTLTGTISAGQNATYTISVKNNGPSDAVGVIVSDTPPAGMTFVSNSGACSGTFPCNVGTLTAGQIVSINSTFAVSSGATGSLTNTASVSSSAIDPQPTDNTASSTAPVGITADVSIAKSGPATAQPGTNITYAITVFNSGPGDATGVVVTDPLPARLTFVSAAGACTSFPCSIGSIPAGTNKFITATYNVTPGPNTTITNVATVSATSTDPNSANDSASKATAIGCHTTPNGLAPSADQTNVPTNGTLHWNNAGATSYNVYLGPVGSGCTTLLGNTTSTSMSYSGLTGGTTYEWRVESISAGCSSAASSCQKFTTATVCPGNGPTLIAPLAGSQQSSPIVFSWTAVPSASLYHLFAAVGGASTLEIGSTTETTLTANVGDGATVWFVIADVAGCGTLQSVSGTFNVCNNASPVAGVVAEASSGQSYDVAWQSVAGATKYEIDEATNAAFTNAQTQTVTTTSVTYTHTAATSAQPFFYRVRAFSSCRQQFGSYSETIRIVIA